jgi:hypothetical protein
VVVVVVVAGFVAILLRFVVAGLDNDATGDGWGVADGKSGFTVFGIPHIRASVVLTTLRSGLLGSHIIDLSSCEIGLLAKPPVVGDCAYTWALLQTAETRILARRKNAIKV